MKPEEYAPHLDVASYLKARALWASRALEDELSHPIDNPWGENVHTVYAQTLEKEREEAVRFCLALGAVPEAKTIASATFKEQWEMREKLTPQQQEYRKLEQNMMRNPYGDFDMGVILTLQTEDPINYEGHVDFDAYWKRRAEWAERIEAGVTQYGETLGYEQNCVKRFLQIIAEIPRVQQLVETEMARLREERVAIRKREPTNPHSRFAFDMNPPVQQQEHSTFNDYNISGIGFVVPNQGGGLDEPSGFDDRSQ